MIFLTENIFDCGVAVQSGTRIRTGDVVDVVHGLKG
jgi:hypothetical protein